MDQYHIIGISLVIFIGCVVRVQLGSYPNSSIKGLEVISIKCCQ